MARLRRDHFIDLRPLTQSPAFARLWIGSTLAGLGGQLTIVAVMLHVFELTGSNDVDRGNRGITIHTDGRDFEVEWNDFVEVVFAR